MASSRVFWAVAIGSFSASSFAIIPDFGADTDYLGVGQMGGASCVAISSNWVITAKHVGGMTVNFGSDVVATERFDHPTSDISLLHFSGNPFANFYDIDFSDQLGNQVTIVGFGGTGTAGDTGINIGAGEGTRRKANNVIDLEDTVDLGNGSIFNGYIYDLDGPTGNGSLGGGAVDHEGGLWFGDSGGGFFHDGKLIGINSFVGDETGNNQFNDYGDIGGCVDLGTYQDWIRSTSGVPEPSSLAVLGLGAVAFFKRRKKSS